MQIDPDRLKLAQMAAAAATQIEHARSRPQLQCAPHEGRFARRSFGLERIEPRVVAREEIDVPGRFHGA